MTWKCGTDFLNSLSVTGRKQVDFDPTEIESGMVLETLPRRETQKVLCHFYSTLATWKINSRGVCDSTVAEEESYNRAAALPLRDGATSGAALKTSFLFCPWAYFKLRPFNYLQTRTHRASCQKNHLN